MKCHSQNTFTRNQQAIASIHLSAGKNLTTDNFGVLYLFGG